MQNKFNNFYYNNIVAELNTKVHQKSYSYTSDSLIPNENAKWVNTSTKEIELKKVLSKLDRKKSYNDNSYRIYTYEGHCSYNKNFNFKYVRSLIELEPRVFKSVINNAKLLKDELKNSQLECKKYKLLFEYKTKVNYYNELLSKLKEDYDNEEKAWSDLNDYYGYPNDDYTDFDYLSEEEQINRTLEHEEKINYISNRISNVYNEIDKLNKKIKDILENGISENLIACDY